MFLYLVPFKTQKGIQCTTTLLTQDVTDTSVSPALSRDNNRKCLAFGFYDSHDFWHFASSFALFFSFLILLALDEGQENKVRTDIKTF